MLRSPSKSSDRHVSCVMTAKRMLSYGKINGNSLPKTTLTAETTSERTRVSYIAALRRVIFRQNSRRRHTEKRMTRKRAELVDGDGTNDSAATSSSFSSARTPARPHNRVRRRGIGRWRCLADFVPIPPPPPKGHRGFSPGRSYVLSTAVSPSPIIIIVVMTE